MKPVLNPRIKLEYYLFHNWKDIWIEEAKNTLCTVYNKNYTPLSRLVYCTNSEVDDTDTAIEVDNINAELNQYIFFNKRQKLTTNPEQEVDAYLKSEIVKFQSGVDTLSWW